MVMLYFKKDDFAKEIKSCSRYLSVTNPSATTTDGLLQCLQEMLMESLGIEDICDCVWENRSYHPFTSIEECWF